VSKKRKKKAAPLLHVKGLKKTFFDSGSAIQVLKGVTLQIESGRHFSITGHSGSGKSTLLNVICGLEGFDDGSIQWNQQAINELSQRDLVKLRGEFFGFIFQSYHLMSEINAIENVLLAARFIGKIKPETKARAEELLVTVGLKDRLNHPVQKLSGGERQRVAIARALINSPKVILADEPTGNLDEHTAQEVMNLIFEVCKKNDSSLLLVTHNPEFAKLTDNHGILQEGILKQL